MTTVALYARVSSQNQMQNNTIASQIVELKRRIAEDEHKLLDEYVFTDNGISGWLLEHNGLRALRDKVVEGKIDKIYIHSLDRLSRKPAHQMILLDEFAKVEVIFLNYKVEKNPESRLFLGMQGLLSECETLRTMERSSRGRIYRAKEGKVSVINNVPFGFRRINHVDREKIRIEIDEEEAKIVRELFEWIGIERISIKEAIRRLKERCILSPKGKRLWSTCTINKILRNTAVIGGAVYGKTKVGPPRKIEQAMWKVRKQKYSVYKTKEEDWIKIPIPRIIEDELFYIVQRQLDENRERARVQRKGRRHLLQGLVACVCCKYSYYVSGSNQENRYYRCTGTEASRCYGTKVCNSQSVKAEILETAVWDEIKKILKDPDAIAKEYRLRMLKHEKEEPNDKLEKERNRLEQGIKRLAHVYIQGYISQEEYEQEIGEMEKRLKVIGEQQEKTVNKKQIESELDFSIGGLKAFASEFKSELDQANFETKLKIILYLVRVIKMDHDDVYIVFRFQEAAMEMQKKNVQHYNRIPVSDTWMTGKGRWNVRKKDYLNDIK